MAEFPIDQNSATAPQPIIEVPTEFSEEEKLRQQQLAANLTSPVVAPTPTLKQETISPIPKIAQALGIHPEQKIVEKAIDLQATKEAEQQLKQQKAAEQESLRAEIEQKRALDEQRRAQELAADAQVHAEKSAVMAQAKSAQEEENKLASINQEIDKQVEEYVPRTAGEILRTGNFGEKLAAAFGMLLGGYAGGLTKQFNNPFTETLNKAVDQYAEQKRLNLAEAAAVREAAYKAQDAQLKQLMAKNDTIKDNLQIQKLQQDLQAGIQSARQDAIKQRYLASGQVNDPSLFNEKEAERAVRLSDGTYRLAANKSLAEDLNKYRNDVEPAIDGAKRIMEFAKNSNRLSPSDRAKVGVELQALVGQLRLPFVGPGALTDKEYERIQSTLGDPNAIFALKDVELKKLSTVMNKLQKDLKGRFARAGIDLPKSNEESLVDKLSAKGYSAESVQKALDKIKNK